MINPNLEVQEKVVLFMDILGFASLTEEHPLQLNFIKDSDKFFENISMTLSGQENSLTRVFTGFHRALKHAINLAQRSHPLTAITFSDSAYIATNQLYEAANIASYFIQALIPQRIPVRAGIAYGTFEAVRFLSDVTLDGGDHAAHFLGTGVVHSHAAESCGIKGIRILLHPSAAALLKDLKHNPARPEKNRIDHIAHFEEAILQEIKSSNSKNDLPHFEDFLRAQLIEVANQSAEDIRSERNRIHYLECPSEERSNSLHVQYEINYWRFKPTAELKAWHSLQDMWDGAPQSALIHYEATAQAINRMRVSHGEAPLKNLRRRTLPRTRK